MRPKAEKTAWLHLRLTQQEREALRAAAQRDGSNVSDLARAALAAGLKAKAAPAIGKR